jgi:membrane protease YdiL (CAAX protease family)
MLSSSTMTSSAPPWDFLVILGVLGIVVPWRGKVRVRTLLARPSVEPAERIAMYGSTIAFQWIAATFTAWRCYVRGWDAARLGVTLDRSAFTIAVGVMLASFLALVQLGSLRQLARLPSGESEQASFVYQMARKLMPQSLMEALPFVALVCTVSLCEEFLFRGFAFVVFESVGGGIAAGIVGSAALFGIAHLYQGSRGVVTTSFLGLVFAGTRAYTHSLVPAILAHLVVDLMAGLLAPRMLLRRAAGGLPTS